MTREEASYILRKFYADGYKSNNYNTLEQALKIAVICIENLPHWISVEFPHWISVKDEEPPKGQWIITYEPTSPIVIGTDIILQDETADEHHITHWMPLPSPPKEGGEE